MKNKYQKNKTLYGNKIKCYILYSLLFCLISAIVYLPFYINNKSFVFSDIWGGGDGISQHYTALAYYGQYLRTFFHNLFINHTFSLPMWDMSIGLGADIITTLNYYVLGDPFSFLAVFCPIEKTEILYNILILVRLYFAGMAFMSYSFYMGQDEFASFIGTFVYVFCGYGLMAPILHPYFANPMIWLPLLLIGIEKIYREEQPFFYIGILALSAVSNFYFFYMICIVIIIYAVFRYFMLFKTWDTKAILVWLFRFIKYSLLSVGMAMILLLPTINSMMSVNRIGVERFIPWIYPIRYYKEFFGTFISATFNSYYTYMGYAGIALLSLFLLFINGKENKLWKRLFIVTTLLLCIPYAGHVFNGFAYVTNRWIWFYSFIVSYLTVLAVPKLLALERKAQFKLTICTIVYLAVLVLNREVLSSKIKAAAVILIGYLIVLLLQNISGLPRCLIKLGIISVMVFNIMVNGWYVYAARLDNYIGNFQDRETVWETACLNVPSSLLDQIEDRESYRYDTGAIGAAQLMRNSAMLKNLNGTSFYFSTTNDNLSHFFEEMYMNYNMEQNFENLDGRSIMDFIAGTKYYIIPNGGEVNLPYGYSNLEKQNENYTLYSAENSLKFAYMYDQYIDREQYNDLDVVQKQQALLEGVVLDQESFLPPAKLEFFDQRLPAVITSTDGLTYSEGRIEVQQGGAAMRLNVEGVPDSEVYVILEGMNYSAASDAEGGVTDVSVLITDDSVGKAISFRTPLNNYYCGRNNFLCNLGYRKNAVETITLTFPQAGIYELEDLSVVCQPFDTLKEYQDKLSEKNVKLDKIDDNRYQCKVDNDKNQFLTFAIPYSKGWQIKVDGKLEQVLRANTMNFGVELTAGEHLVEISYSTPLLGIGAVISCISVLIFLAAIIKNMKYNDKNNI